MIKRLCKKMLRGAEEAWIVQPEEEKGQSGSYQGWCIVCKYLMEESKTRIKTKACQGVPY